MSNGVQETNDCWAIAEAHFSWSIVEIQGMDFDTWFGIVLKTHEGSLKCDCYYGVPEGCQDQGVELDSLDAQQRYGWGTWKDCVSLGACAGASGSSFSRTGCSHPPVDFAGGQEFCGPFKWSQFRGQYTPFSLPGLEGVRTMPLEQAISECLGTKMRGPGGRNLQEFCDDALHSTNLPVFNKTEEDLQQFLSGPGEEDDEELVLFCLSYLSLNGHVQLTWSTNDDGSMFIAYDCVLNIDTLEGCSKINLCDDIKNGPGGWPSEQEGDAGEGQLTIHFQHLECLDCGGCGKEGVEVNNRRIHKSGASTGGKGELPGGLAGEWIIIYKLWKDAQRGPRPGWEVQKDSNDFFRALAASIGPAYPLSCPPRYMCLGGGSHITKGDGWPKFDWLEFEKRMDGSNWQPGDERSRPATWLEVAEFVEGLGLDMQATITKKPRALGDGTNPKDSPDEDW